jgi:anti-sigma B factor antagonist
MALRSRPGYGGAVEAFRLHSSERNGCAVLQVFGEVDLSTAPQLREDLTAMVAGGELDIVVDLSATEFLDSTGLGALVTGLKRVRAKGGNMKVVCTSPRVCKVFEITSIDKVMPLLSSVDEACAGA